MASASSNARRVSLPSTSVTARTTTTASASQTSGHSFLIRLLIWWSVSCMFVPPQIGDDPLHPSQRIKPIGFMKKPIGYIMYSIAMVTAQCPIHMDARRGNMLVPTAASLARLTESSRGGFGSSENSWLMMQMWLDISKPGDCCITLHQRWYTPSIQWILTQ